jgi:hypothetical protein
MAIGITFVGENGQPVADNEAWQALRVGAPLVFDNDALEKFADLKRRAEANVIGYEQMKKLAEDYEAGLLRGAPDYCVAQTIKIAFGWEITYTVEEHKEGVPCRHLSLSAPNKHRQPIPAAIDMVISQFGFQGSFRHCAFWPEELTQGGVAINVLQPMSGNMSEIMHTEGNA